MFFSIIVPVYNIEKYLRECLDSIFAQDFSDYEVLLIDDGSTDSSGFICDEYLAKYPTLVRVIHQVNGGLSYTRNVGITHAKGKYVVFVDGDDYIDKESLSSFYSVLKKSEADVLITRLIEFTDQDNKPKYLDQTANQELLTYGTKNDVVKEVFTRGESTWTSVKYIVRLDFLRQSKLLFTEGLYHEDIDWTPRLFLKAQTFAYVGHHWYYHRINRHGSLNSTPNVKKVLDVISTISSHIANPDYQVLDEETRLVVFKRLARSLYPSIKKYHLFTKDEKLKILKLLQKNKFILKYATKKSHKLFNLVCRTFGFRIGLSFTRFL